MFLGKVIGNVVSTVKWETLEGFKLLLIQPLDCRERAVGSPIVATDRIGVGVGELVFLEKSKEAVLGLADPLVPSDSSVLARVDAIYLSET